MRSYVMVLVSSVVALACTERRLAPPPPPSAPLMGAPPLVDAAAPSDDPAAEADLVLPIPARSQAPESPPAGWCGETAIQEGLLYFGRSVPQSVINRAGHPVHPDLYATEIPNALRELGVKFTPYAGGRGYEGFRRWVEQALAAGHPVLAGVKLVPSAHPEWGLDHFVLVVGHGRKGLLVNTTWGYRAWVAEDGASGLSLKNAFYGYRLDGLGR